jgi:SMP-30/Gluconolactonase/LRE-like region
MGPSILWVSLVLAWLGQPARPPEPGQVRTIADSIPVGTGGLALGPDGNLYQADFGVTLNRGPVGTKVIQIGPDGRTRVFATGFRGASGNTFDPDGNLLQSNVAGNTLTLIRPDGAVRTVVDSGLVAPVGVTRGPDGAYYVANCGNNTIRRVTLAGASTVFSTDSLLQCPNGITLADDGNLYVANFRNGDVVRIDRQGRGTRLTTLPGHNNGHLIFGNGVLYVVGRKANQLFEVTLDGRYRAIAGTGERGGRDGPAAEATLSLPNDVALSPDGLTLYFCEVAAAGPGDQVLAPTRVRALTLHRSR